MAVEINDKDLEKVNGGARVVANQNASSVKCSVCNGTNTAYIRNTETGKQYCCYNVAYHGSPYMFEV